MVVQTSAVITSVLAAKRACRVFSGDAFCLRSHGNEPRSTWCIKVGKYDHSTRRYTFIKAVVLLWDVYLIYGTCLSHFNSGIYSFSFIPEVALFTCCQGDDNEYSPDGATFVELGFSRPLPFILWTTLNSQPIVLVMRNLPIWNGTNKVAPKHSSFCFFLQLSVQLYLTYV